MLQRNSLIYEYMKKTLRSSKFENARVVDSILIVELIIFVFSGNEAKCNVDFQRFENWMLFGE